jgi:hypothetical protein
MLRFLGRLTLFTAVLAITGVSAHAQYGWGGWGGGTSAGGFARGAGVMAAGAGVYNQQTAEARSINANTYMQMNSYLGACNQNCVVAHAALLAKNNTLQKETAASTYNRLHNNPTPHDVHTGDALNVVLEELTNPNVYTAIVQKANQPIPTQLVKNIEFEYAANMIAISLDDFSANGVPDVLLTTSEITPERKAFRALVTKAKQEVEATGQVSPETLANCRSTIDAAKQKVDAIYPQGSPKRAEADNYLKALYGLTKMLKTPTIAPFLKELNTLPTTDIAHLLTFMHSFNLRFGAAKTPVQEATYDQLYPMLAALRDQAQVQNPMTNPLPAGDPKHVSAYFSGMDYSQLGDQPGKRPGVAPAPPRPGPSSPQ